MKKPLIVLLLLILFGGAPTAQAAYLYDWSNNPHTSVIDPDDPYPPVPAGTDILKVLHAYDGGFHYFRMDLEEAPAFTGMSYAFLHGIYINSKSGGVDGPVSGYIPNSLTGIDQILDSHYSPYLGGFIQDDFHDNMSGSDPSAWSLTKAQAPGVFETLKSDGGKTLEWKIIDTAIGSTFSWWAATHDVCPTGEITYDVTNRIDVNPVPIPGAVLLFGSGLLGLLGFKKKLGR